VNAQAIFGFHQLPRAPGRVRELAERGVTAIAFEMVRDARGGFPLVAPMSVIAGRMALEIAVSHLGHVPSPVLILGAGKAGLSAARAAVDAGARVSVLTRSQASREAARKHLGDSVETQIASAQAIERCALGSELVVGAVLVPGEPTPKLLPRALVARMKRGAIIVDISIDGGGVAETSRPTTHAEPTYIAEGVVHYCVANMPGGVPRTSTFALNNATLPFVLALAGKGWKKALADDVHLRNGLNVAFGKITCQPVAEALGYPYVSAESVMAG
jgi:alanine dehydrogenase